VLSPKVGQAAELDKAYLDTIKLTNIQTVAGRKNNTLCLPTFGFCLLTVADIWPFYSKSRRPGLRAGSLDKNPNTKIATNKATTI